MTGIVVDTLTLSFPGPQGPQGAAGAGIISGSGAPGSGLGNNGDVYVDTTNGNLYGPKTAGSWGTAISLTGPAGADGQDGLDGNSVLSGTGAPSSGTGNDGDYYINTATYDIYGPKTAGAWGSATSLIGANGTNGTDGADGLSAYEVAVANGFSGTESEWLASLEATGPVQSVNGQTGDVVLTTTNVAEGSNLYYTNARGIGSVITGFVAGAGTVAATDTILQAINKIVGNISALVSSVSSVFGRTGAVTAADGDYTASQVTNVPSGGIAAVTVQNALNELDTEKASLSGATFTGAVNLSTLTASEILATDSSKNIQTLTTATYPSLTELARVKGITTAGQSMITAASATAQTALLDTFTSGAKGLAPASGGGTSNFLRADGTWAAPSGGSGTVTSVAMSVPTGLAISGSPITTSGTLTVTLDTGYVIPTQAALDAKVAGPASSVDNTVARYDGTTGKIIQGTGVTIDDSDNLTVPANVTAKTGNYYNSGGLTLLSIRGGTNTIYGNSQPVFEVRNSSNTQTALMRADGLICSAQFGTLDDKTAFFVDTSIATSDIPAGINMGNAAIASWSSTMYWWQTKDAGLSRISSGLIGVGNGQQGSYSGGLKLTSLNHQGLTASTIVLADASKNVVSASTATYPDLTELSYVKGVTSAIQTQLNSKISGNQTITLSGDASGSGTTAITVTLANTAVSAASYGSATQVGTFTVDAKGRLTAAGNTTISIPATAISDSTSAGRSMLTAASATAQTALLDTFTSGAKGLAPASGGGTSNFLRADGTWAAPSGGGGGTNLGLVQAFAAGLTGM